LGKEIKVLGISPAHDSSVCLYEDGKILKFLKEERLSKSKRDHRPILSLVECLKDVSDVDIFVHAPAAEGSYDQFFEDWVHIVNKLCDVKINIDSSSEHHLQHASLAFYNSGFDEAAVIVADGAGSYIQGLQELESIFHASYPDKFIPVYKNFQKKVNDAPKKPEYMKAFPSCEVDSNSSLGIVSLYCSGTVLIGQNPLENGKTMGLSSYGTESGMPDFILNNSNLIDGNYFIGDSGGAPLYKEYFFSKVADVTENNYLLYANYAYHLQKQTEIAMEYLINKAIEKTGLKNICITGGYGLNIIANARFIKNFPGINFYFEPIADDSGNSIGSAMLEYRRATKDTEIKPIKDTFFHGERHNLVIDGSVQVEYAEIVRMLDQQKTVAMYYKLAEAGPRALGHRSILFDARNVNAKQIVNLVKKREWYRPFAAACLEEDAHKYFELYDNPGYEFMTINTDANELAKKEIPGVLHVDNTCRIQIIKNTEEPLFQLLKEFKKLTGVGILLNTSFNLAGEALVETPDDAVKTFNESELDCLWFPEISRALVK
jgi:carbamoyltransferase